MLTPKLLVCYWGFFDCGDRGTIPQKVDGVARCERGCALRWRSVNKRGGQKVILSCTDSRIHRPAIRDLRVGECA